MIWMFYYRWFSVNHLVTGSVGRKTWNERWNYALVTQTQSHRYAVILPLLEQASKTSLAHVFNLAFPKENVAAVSVHLFKKFPLGRNLNWSDWCTSGNCLCWVVHLTSQVNFGTHVAEILQKKLKESIFCYSKSGRELCFQKRCIDFKVLTSFPNKLIFKKY